jgi:hypothetical protein
MGLLDDAIREHLELKRLRGADPDEVAREERAAFASTRGHSDAESAEHSADEDGPISLGDSHYPKDDDPLVPRAGPASEGDDPIDSADDAYPEADDPSDPDLAHTIQETAELDMRTVLEAEEFAEDAPRSKHEREPPETDDASNGTRDQPRGIRAWAQRRAR